MARTNSTASQSALDARARRAARRVGLLAHKSRAKASFDNQGGYMLVDSNNCVNAGRNYDLSAEDVIAYCSEE